MLLKTQCSLSIGRAFDNIAMPLQMSGRKPRDYADDVRELVDFVGLGEAADLPVEKLSGRGTTHAPRSRARWPPSPI